MEHYTTIDDMPVFNWLKIQETNDLTWIMHKKVDESKCTGKELILMQQSLQNMTDQYLDAYGVSDEYRKVLILKGELYVLRAELIATQDKTKLTFIDIKKDELKALLMKSNSTQKTNVRVYASKYMRYSIDMKQTSVRDFYDILEDAREEIKTNQRER